MKVYEDYQVYGPYTRKDNRKHIVLIKHNDKNSIINRKVVSYPKYLVEVYLNRYLNNNETIDHIDGNFNNNELNNLRIIDREEHARSHVSIRPIIIKKCIICGKSFETKDNTRIICNSKSCAGKCTHINGYNKGNSFKREKNNLISNRSLVGEIQSVEDTNSGKLLVGNPEQEE